MIRHASLIRIVDGWVGEKKKKAEIDTTSIPG